MTRRPWFAIRDLGEGYSLNLIHWKGAAALLASFAVCVVGLLGAWLWLGPTRTALGLGLAVSAASLAWLYSVTQRRTIDERPRDRP
ncbi:hypothetical protein [Caulobacter sp. CCG-8]|uniref:hypothetical protein n=1 Tax=Caulobacter sp. CCG-8 TaxID=3127958 RepID=UPI00307E7A61